MQSESESLVICRLFATRAALKAPSPPSPPLKISPGLREPPKADHAHTLARQLAKPVRHTVYIEYVHVLHVVQP